MSDEPDSKRQKQSSLVDDVIEYDENENILDNPFTYNDVNEMSDTAKMAYCPQTQHPDRIFYDNISKDCVDIDTVSKTWSLSRKQRLFFDIAYFIERTRKGSIPTNMVDLQRQLSKQMSENLEFTSELFKTYRPEFIRAAFATIANRPKDVNEWIKFTKQYKDIKHFAYAAYKDGKFPLASINTQKVYGDNKRSYLFQSILRKATQIWDNDLSFKNPTSFHERKLYELYNVVSETLFDSSLPFTAEYLLDPYRAPSNSIPMMLCWTFFLDRDVYGAQTNLNYTLKSDTRQPMEMYIMYFNEAVFADVEWAKHTNESPLAHLVDTFIHELCHSVNTALMGNGDHSIPWYFIYDQSTQEINHGAADNYFQPLAWFNRIPWDEVEKYVKESYTENKPKMKITGPTINVGMVLQSRPYSYKVWAHEMINEILNKYSSQMKDVPVSRFVKQILLLTIHQFITRKSHFSVQTYGWDLVYEILGRRYDEELVDYVTKEPKY